MASVLPLHRATSRIFFICVFGGNVEVISPYRDFVI
jgi:hypothetical protein